MKFESPANKSEFVRVNFSKIAKRYDLFNDLITQYMHRRWKNLAVEEAKVEPHHHVIDLCCGTGDITLRLSKKIGDSGLCIGVDFSEDMLNIARQRVKTQKVIFNHESVYDLTYEDGSFDAITIGYGLRNLDDIDSCLKIAFNLLKPGGRFVILDMGKVTLPLLKQMFSCYFFYVVPALGELLHPGEKMFNYFPASTIDFPGPSELSSRLKKVGFKTVKIKKIHFGSIMLLTAIKN